MKTLVIFLICLLYVMLGIVMAAHVIKDEEDSIMDTDENAGCGIVMLALFFGIFWLPVSIVYCVYRLVKLLYKKLKKQ